MSLHDEEHTIQAVLGGKAVIINGQNHAHVIGREANLLTNSGYESLATR